MYRVDSEKAEEFINHQEVLDTLEYARANKNNHALIEQLITKAAQCKGLTHREAALLLECDQPELTDRIFHLAKEIKQKFYGNRIVMFAPLYLSNYCVNGCTYCPYHLKNKTIARKKLTQEEIRREVIALQNMGHKRLALEAGEHPLLNPIEYILESIDTIYSIKHRNGAIRPGKREYCGYNGRKLYPTEGCRNRHLYPLSGDLSQGKLRAPPPHRPQK